MADGAEQNISVTEDTTLKKELPADLQKFFNCD